MDKGILWFAAIALALNLLALFLFVRAFSKGANGMSPAEQWSELLKDGWRGAKRMWPALTSGQKRFLVLSSILSGGAFIGAVALGMEGANCVAKYFHVPLEPVSLPFGLSWFGVWGMQLLVTAGVFAHLQYSQNK